MRWAEQYQQIAVQEVNKANATSDLGMRYALLKDAMAKADMARTLTSRVNSVLGAQDQNEPEKQGGQTPQVRAIKSIDIQGDSFALWQARKALDLSKNSYARASFGDFRQDATGYDLSNQALTVPDGQSVDVRYLQGAFKNAQVAPQKPLFVSVPPPPGQTQAVHLDESVRNDIISRDKQVGGVALEVTLDLLSFLKVSGFEKLGPSVEIESPVLISLKELHKEALSYSHTPDKWKTLPAQLRYPGNAERIHGFVLDPKNKDIFLVCAPARSQDTRLDIDSLIVGLRTAWLLQKAPFVSLDPLPEDRGGPQYVRVMDVPRNSLFAKIMLDADYAMKRIVLGDIKIDLADFRNIVQLRLAKKEGYFSSRFWFYPIPLGSGDIRASASGRSIIFASGVQLLSAQRHVIEGKLVDTGMQDEIAVEEASTITRCYEQFERSSQIEPHGIYVLMHGLVDIVTIGKLLEYMGIDYPVLRDLSGLPFTEYEVPHYYQGISAKFKIEKNGMAEVHTLAGGVHIQPNAGDYSLEWYRDSVTVSLERAVDNFNRNKGYSASIHEQLVLPKPGYGSGGDVESLMAAGRAALALRQYQTARDHFLKVTEEDPFHVEAYVQLGMAYALLDQFDEASKALAKAVDIEPGDNRLKAILLDIDLRNNPELDLKSQDESVMRMVSKAYTEEAMVKINQRYNDDARNKATTAIRLWDSNADAYFARALTYPYSSSSEAQHDLLQAVRFYRKALSEEPNDPEIKARLARALGVHASGRLMRLKKPFTGGLARTGADWVEELSQITNEAHDGGLIDDKEPECVVIEILARATRFGILQAAQPGGLYTIAPVLELADLAVKRFPDNSYVHWARAYALSVAEKYKEAQAELKKAIDLDPGQGMFYLGRADLYAKQNLYDEAKTVL